MALLTKAYLGLLAHCLSSNFLRSANLRRRLVSMAAMVNTVMPSSLAAWQACRRCALASDDHQGDYPRRRSAARALSVRPGARPGRPGASGCRAPGRPPFVRQQPVRPDDAERRIRGLSPAPASLDRVLDSLAGIGHQRQDFVTATIPNSRTGSVATGSARSPASLVERDSRRNNYTALYRHGTGRICPASI